MEESIISYEVAVLAKEKGFGYDIINSEIVVAAGNNLQHRGSYLVFAFKFWEYSPSSEYLGTDSAVQLKSTTTNSTCFKSLMEAYNEGNPYGYEAYLATTQSILQKWLREVHEIVVYVNPVGGLLLDIKHYQIRILTYNSLVLGVTYDSYEEALEEGLQTALKLIKL